MLISSLILGIEISIGLSLKSALNLELAVSSAGLFIKPFSFNAEFMCLLDKYTDSTNLSQTLST